MLRSIVVMIVAVIVALGLAKVAEQAIAGVASREVALAASWGFAAFVAALGVLLFGRKWAPLGWMAAATILFNGVITMLTAKLAWPLLPASVALTLGAGWLAIRLTRATYAFQARPDKGPFA